MDILSLIFVLAIIGVAVWAFVTYVPMAQPFKGLIIFLIIIAVCYWLLRDFVPSAGLHGRLL